MTAFFDAQKEFLEAAEANRRRGVKTAALGCCWVALWDPWRSLVSDSADDWCEAVGLAKKPSQTPAWMAVLKYTVRSARRLIRPTQLEAGWYGRHFPTPGECALETGGRVVDGREAVFSTAGRRALREYLHAPIPLDVSYWLDARFPVRRTTRVLGDPSDLERDRSGHWSALREEFPGMKAWMPVPNF